MEPPTWGLSSEGGPSSEASRGRGALGPFFTGVSNYGNESIGGELGIFGNIEKGTQSRRGGTLALTSDD